mmetsp:Transcript_14414/g.50661  ORF Transcript_14414/g.50661 Transcript_14414/m.50661 type:complete len:488 (+) Transcript_14414:223-1686(+)
MFLFGRGDELKDPWQRFLAPVTGAAAAVVVAVLAEAHWHKRRLQRESMRLKLASMVSWAEKQLEIDPKGFPRNLDGKIGDFASYCRVLQAGAEGEKRRSAVLQLQVLAQLLETPSVNSALRAANWRWAAEYERGLIVPREAFARCTIVFPTIIAAAQAATPVGGSGGVEAIHHLANWCSDFLEQPAVQALIDTMKKELDVRLGSSGTRDRGQRTVRRKRFRSCCGVFYEVPASDSPTASSHEIEINDGGLKDSIPRLPRRSQEGQIHCWDDVDPTQMLIRGPGYLEDRCKILSGTAMMRLVCLDTYLTDDPAVHYSSSNRVGNIVRRLREVGDRRFLFITNWLVSPYQFVVVWAVPEDPDWMSSPEGLLFSRFRGMGDDERNARLKLIPRVIEAPLLVRKALPEIPSIIGRKLPISYFVGDDYIEASINVVSSSTGRRTLGLMAGSSRWFSVEVYLVIEAQSQEELPERILGGFSISKLNLGALPTR